MTGATRSLDFDVASAAVPIDLFPRQRIKFSLGVDRSKDRRDKEADRRRDRLRDLVRWQAWDILKAIQDGTLEVGEVCRRITQGGEGSVIEMRAEVDRARARAMPLFRDEVTRFLLSYATRRSEHSAVQRRSQLARFGRVTRTDGVKLEDLSIDQLTRADVELGINAVSDSVNTREGIRIAVSGLYTWSIGEESEAARIAKRAPRWTVNPASLVESVPKEVRVGTVAREQIVRLLAACEPYQEAYLRAFLHLGLREGELMHTRLHTDLDVEAWRWRIQKRGPDARCPCVKCVGKGWRPKTRLSSRELLVPESADDSESVHPLRSAIERYLELYPASPGDFVFRNPRTGRGWIARSLCTDFATLCARADVRYGRDVPGGITLHTLRHTAATDLVRAGVRESVIARILGDTVKTIVDTYVHLSAEDLASGVARGSTYDI